MQIILLPFSIFFLKLYFDSQSRFHIINHSQAINMNQHPDRLVEQIQRKMAGASYNKTEEEKAVELFDYQPKDALENSKAEQTLNVSFISKTLADESLRKVFQFYATAYARLKIKHVNTFEHAKQFSQIMNFQSFLLFCRQFKLVPQIFTLESISVAFKKHSNYGKSLTLDDFINLVNNLSHQKQALTYFKVDSYDIANRQFADEKDMQQFYGYLGLGYKEIYTGKFKPVVQAFGSSAKIQGTKIPYKYRKMSVEELTNKILPRPLDENSSKSPLKALNNKSSSVKFIRPSNPEILVSWQSIQKGKFPQMNKGSRISTLFREQEQDKIYLKEYASKIKADNLRKQIQKRITDIKKQDTEKQKQLLGRVTKQTTTPYIH